MPPSVIMEKKGGCPGCAERKGKGRADSKYGTRKSRGKDSHGVLVIVIKKQQFFLEGTARSGPLGGETVGLGLKV